MGWWFGRKSAPADARPFVPAWLTNESAEEGFARSYQAQFDEVYRRNPVGQRSVRLLAGMLGGLTIDAIEGDPRAAALVHKDGLLEKIAASLLLHGNAYAVPQEIDRAIEQTLTAISPIRAVANVVKVGSAGYRKLIANGGTPSGFVGFEDARPETDTPTFTEVVPPSGELYANPAVSQQMLDDAMFDVEKFLASEIATEFARAEGAAFVRGNGINQPLGFLSSPTSAAVDSARPMGTLQTIGTGVAGAFAASEPEDALIDLVQSLRSPYRQGAAFVMNSATAAQIRKFKTTDGAFLFQPSLAAGQPATLLGYPLIEAEDMPDIAAGSLSIAFGNFKAGYVIAERNATSILRDPYTHKPYVHFYATKRVGGQVVNSEAIKLLKFA